MVQQTREGFDLITSEEQRGALRPRLVPTVSRSCLVAVTYKSVGSTQGGRGKSGNKSL
jgi:hypothetical protein